MEIKDIKKDESNEALLHHASILEIDPCVIDALNEEAKTLTKKQQYDGAIACCKRTLDIDPNNTKALGYKGFSLMRKGRYDEAIACFDAVLAVKFVDGYSLHWKWETLRKQQRYDEIINLSDKVTPSSSEYVHALEYKGYAYYKKGQYDKALKLLDLALDIQQEPWTLKVKLLVLFHQGRHFEEQQKYDEALLRFDKAFDIRPANLAPLKAKGRIFRNRNLIAEALAVYDQILKINPSNFGFLAFKTGVFNHLEEYDEALAFLNQVSLSVQQYPWILEAKSSMFFGKGCMLEKQQQYDDAISCFKKILETEPGHAEALGHQGFSLMRQGAYDEAIACFDTVLATNFHDGFSLHWKWETLRKQQHFDEMIALSDKISPNHSQYIHALEYKGCAYFEKDQYDEAIKSLDLALAIKQSQSTLDTKCLVLCHKSCLLEEQQKYNEALLCLDEALKIKPKDLNLLEARNQILANKGLWLIENRRYGNAIRRFYAKLAAEPQNIYVLHLMGEALRRKENYKDAMQCCEVALAIDPLNTDVLYIKGESLRMRGQYHAAIQSCNLVLAIKPFDIDTLNTKGAAFKDKGNYARAIKCFDQVLALKPNNKFALKRREIALQKLQYPTPFKLLIDAYGKTFWLSNKKVAYTALVTAARDIKKPVVEQLCSLLQNLFMLKFLEAPYEKNDNGTYRLLTAREGEEEKLLKKLLMTWSQEKKKITEQYQFIECLVGLYLQNWYQEGWLDAESWFVIESQQIGSIVQLLKSMPQQFNFSTLAMYENILLFILKIDAGFEKETTKHGILIHYLCGEQEMALKELMCSTLKEVEEKYFKDNPERYQSYLATLKEKEKTQFLALRQKQLGRVYMGIFTSRVPNVSIAPQIKWSSPVSSVSLDKKTETFSETFAEPPSADIKKSADHKHLVPLPMASETTRMNELLNRIDTDGNDAREFAGIFISRGDIRFNFVDKDSDYTADFINLLLYPLKESQSENIFIYPVTTLKELPKYFGDKGIETQPQRYAFITLHVPYNPESPLDNNHWAVLIVDKKEHAIFYLDPAKVGIPPTVEDLRSYLKYIKPIVTNPIDFQKAEKLENKIRHCGVYVVEMFKVFAQCIRNNQTIMDTKNPIKSSDKERISLRSVLRSISYGLKEAAVHRQTHIDSVCAILKTLPPIQTNKKPTAMVKIEVDQNGLNKFCIRLSLSDDKAHLAIVAFYEVLLGRLESRKTTSEVMSSGIISYTEKGNWAKLKKAGWMILKSAPFAGKVLKYGHL